MISQKLKPFSLVIAVAQNGGIGYKGTLPWPYLPKEMKHFVDMTTSTEDFSYSMEELALKKCFYQSNLKLEESQSKSSKFNAVIMGRKTWESIPLNNRPLKNRLNVVLSSNLKMLEGISFQGNQWVQVYNSFLDALREVSLNDKVNEVLVIGGSQIYLETINKYQELIKLIIWTRINKEYECDTFLPLMKDFHAFANLYISKTYSHKDVSFDYCYLGNKELLQQNPQLIPTRLFDKYPKNEEMQYLEIIKDIIDNGEEKIDRTGVGTLSKFGATMRFNLEDSFPLLTTKKVSWKSIVEELLWFIKGDTNAKHLQEKKVKIWDGNSTREYLDSIGLTEREEGDLGPIYGFQWRHFGALYKTMHDDYTNQGIDQLLEVIKQLKTKPESRRIILSSWNPVDLSSMALPPCHILSQFSVSKDNKLSCILFQRSCDLGLGVPFNIASYSLLTCILAKICNLGRGEFIHVMGDTHIYKNHIEQLKEQITRYPNPFPILEINESVSSIDDLSIKDFKLINYTPHPKIKMEMAV